MLSFFLFFLEKKCNGKMREEFKLNPPPAPSRGGQKSCPPLEEDKLERIRILSPSGGG